MSGFDPDAFVAGGATGGFDPDAFANSGPLPAGAVKQKDGTYLVPTPDGPAHVDAEGNPIGAAAVGEKSTKEKALETALAFTHGAAQGLTPYVAGAKSVAEELFGDKRTPGAKTLGDIYRHGRDAAAQETSAATEAHPIANIAGSIATTAMAPTSVAGRLAVASGLGAANAATSSKADLTRGEGAELLKDTLEGGAIGLGAGVLGEGLGYGLRKAGSYFTGKAGEAVAQQAAKDAAAVEEEIGKLRGALGSETQQGSRMLENIQRAAAGLPEKTGIAGAVGEGLQKEAMAALESPASRELAEGVLKRNLAELPGKQASIEALQGELAARTATQAEEAAKRTAEYFSKPLVASEIVPRLKTLAPRFGMAAFGMATGALYDATLGDGSGRGIAGGFAGSVLGAPGVRQMLKNVASSPRVRVAVANKMAGLLQKASQAIGLGLVPTLNTLAPQMMHEKDLGEPSLAAEQLVARGGLKSVISDNPPDPVRLSGVNAPQSELDRAIMQTAGLMTVAGALDDHHQKEDAALTSVARGDKSEPSEKHVVLPEDIHTLASNPELIIKRAANNMGGLVDVAPAIHANVVATTQRAVQYLAKISAVPPKTGPMAPDWTPSQAEKWTISKASEVIQDPLSILKHAASGTLTKEQIEALKFVYPMLTRSIQDKALQLATAGKDMPYKSRLSFGLLTGIDFDGTMKTLQSNQAAISLDKDKMPNKSGGIKPTQKGLSDISIADRTATAGQSQENRERRE